MSSFKVCHPKGPAGTSQAPSAKTRKDLSPNFSKMFYSNRLMAIISPKFPELYQGNAKI